MELSPLNGGIQWKILVLKYDSLDSIYRVRVIKIKIRVGS